MKTESTVHYVLRLALTLLIITSVVAACLAAVNSVTAPRIAYIKDKGALDAIQAILPGEATLLTDEPDGVVNRVFVSDAGFALEVMPNGFHGPITMIVGVDNAGTVLGISVVAQTETASLGAVCAEDNEAGNAFRGQFAGMSGTVAVTKDGGSVDSLSGATITSRGVCAGVQAALDWVAANR